MNKWTAIAICGIWFGVGIASASVGIAGLGTPVIVMAISGMCATISIVFCNKL